MTGIAIAFLKIHSLKETKNPIKVTNENENQIFTDSL